MAAALAIPHWKEAMKSEYNALINNQTWDLVTNTEATRVVQNKWVLKVKYKTDGSLDKYKERLVTKGFQQTPGVDYFETFSLVVKAPTI